MAEYTACHIYTFDCTTTSPAEVGDSGRIHFQQVCIDAMDSPDGRMKTLNTLSKELGLRSLLLLMMDIEGFEHRVVDALLKNFREDPGFTAFLPGQISLEFHHTDLPWLKPRQQITMGALGRTFLALAEMGYSVISREDNSQSPHCSEFTYLRTAC